MNETKRLTEEIKKLSRGKEILKKEKKRSDRKVRALDREDSKKRRRYKHSKRREITIKFV